MTDHALPTKTYLAAILIGLLPVWMALLPPEFNNAPADWQIYMRANSFAVPLIQSIFVLIAMNSRFSPYASVKKLPVITKAAMLTWLVVASFISFQPGKDFLYASIGMAKLVFASLFFLALIDLRTSAGSAFSRILWVSLGCGMLLYMVLWIIFIQIVAPQGDEWIYRIPGVNNVRHTGHFGFAGVVAGLFSLIALRNRVNLWIGWGLPILFGSGGLGLALWTGSRGPLLASLVAIIVTFCLSAGHRKFVMTFFVASGLMATAVVAILPVPHPVYGIAGATGMADLSAENQNDLSSGRAELWLGTIEKIRERPILGWGINQFGKLGPEMPSRLLHPHSFPLQLMFSGGILSVFLMFLVFGPALRRWGWPYTKGPTAAAVGGVMGMLVYSLYDGALYFSYPTMIFLIAIATSIAPVSEQHDHDRSG